MLLGTDKYTQQNLAMTDDRDIRGTIKVDISALKNFINTHYNVYTRDMVTINGIDQPLAMSISMNGNFIVSLGVDMLYSGDSIGEAIRIFNLDIRSLKTLWSTIKADARNVVSHPRAKIEK